ncbi:MAG TPA: hypothetical protein P5080_02800 [Candidatus Paceibacterota bacterium]|nr:hypothetical protein [Candidatus Pacearchaeota archaeon]HRZ50898.1 hypothetical protein [Candidatus Paceibacterota bacterium]HSA36619.1 hypothetical protein [Candidatus Paceibacterota bacterium]
MTNRNKIFIKGLLVGLAMLATSWFMGQILFTIHPQLEGEYRNMLLFRQPSDPLMSLMYVEPFILGLILAWIWSLAKEAIKGETIVMKGVNFGFAYWLLTIPGMMMSYGCFPLSISMVISWSVTILAQGIVAGIILSRFSVPVK